MHACMGLVVADLVEVEPQPAACWVCSQLAVSWAEEPCWPWVSAPVCCWIFLQASGWTAWPCSPTPSASPSAPAKADEANQAPAERSANRTRFTLCVGWNVFPAARQDGSVIPGSLCDTEPHRFACSVHFCPGNSSVFPKLVVCPSLTALRGWETQNKQGWGKKQAQR